MCRDTQSGRRPVSMVSHEYLLNVLRNEKEKNYGELIFGSLMMVMANRKPTERVLGLSFFMFFIMVDGIYRAAVSPFVYRVEKI